MSKMDIGIVAFIFVGIGSIVYGTIATIKRIRNRGNSNEQVFIKVEAE